MLVLNLATLNSAWDEFFDSCGADLITSPIAGKAVDLVIFDDPRVASGATDIEAYSKSVLANAEIMQCPTWMNVQVADMGKLHSGLLELFYERATPRNTLAFDPRLLCIDTSISPFANQLLNLAGSDWLYALGDIECLALLDQESEVAPLSERLTEELKVVHRENARLNQVDNENRQLNDRLASLEKVNQETQDKNLILEQQLATISSKSVAEDDEAASLRDALSLHKNAIRVLENRNQQLQIRYKEVCDFLELKTDGLIANKELLEHRETLYRQVLELQNELELKINEVAELQRELESLRQSYSEYRLRVDAESQNAQQEEALAKAKKEAIQYKFENDLLESHYNDCMKLIQQLDADLNIANTHRLEQNKKLEQLVHESYLNQSFKQLVRIILGRVKRKIKRKLKRIF